MRIAIIDLGTNSVRFDVYSLSPQGKPKLLHRDKLMIRLGQGVFLKGLMDRSAMDRTVHAFQEYKRIADDFNVQKVIAFGTSALREAQDGERLVTRLKEESGIDVIIISGIEEAKLIAQGVLSNEKVPDGLFALVDIGGGSTEISICRGKKVLFSESFRLGTARLQQVFLKKSPPRTLSITQMRGYIRNILSQKMQAEGWPKVKEIIGSSGTVRAAAKMIKKKKGIALDDLAELVQDMSGKTTTELLGMQGMESKRVDMILAGTLLLEEIMRALGAKNVTPTDYSLRDGIMAEEMQLARENKSSLLEFHMQDFYEKAVRFGANEAHLHHMVDLADSLFTRLARLHKLNPEWKIYLLVTVLLRNTGEIIRLAKHEQYSYYIVKNSDFPSMQAWEHEFIARLCLHHGSGKISPKDLDFLNKDKKRKNAFLKLSALMRVVDSLDLGPKTTLKLQRVRIDAKTVQLTISGQAAAGIESMLLERKKKLFEELFKKQLFVVRA